MTIAAPQHVVPFKAFPAPDNASLTAAANSSFSATYDELRRIARIHLRRQLPGLTLDATGLVHEAWIRLQKSAATHLWNDRRHFCRTCASVMRQILIDRSRRRQTVRHGGDLDRVEADLAQIPAESMLAEVLSLSPALERLDREHSHLAEIVQMRFFAGLSHEEIAEALGSSVATVRRQWTLARTLLYSYLQN